MELLSLAEVHIDRLIEQTMKAGCRRLHLRIGQSPYTSSCLAKPLSQMPEYQVPSRLDMQQMVYAILSDEQIISLEQEGEGTFSYPVPRASRAGLEAAPQCSVQVFLSRSDMRVDFTIVPSEI